MQPRIQFNQQRNNNIQQNNDDGFNPVRQIQLKSNVQQRDIDTQRRVEVICERSRQDNNNNVNSIK
jgi:hypothetical protein